VHVRSENDILKSARVEHAFRCVDRAIFVPPTEAQIAAHQRERAQQGAGSHQPPPAGEPTTGSTQAYIDGPVKVGAVHLSAPHMYALVLEKLGVEPGMSVLNVGSGSGYLSCMCAVLVGRGGKSHGVERLPEAVEHANKVTKRWLRRMDAMRKEQQKAQQQVQESAAAASAQQWPESNVEMRDATSTTAASSSTLPAPIAVAAAVAPTSSASDSGRTTPMEVTVENEDADHGPVVASPHVLQHGFSAVDLISPTGEPRRGVVGFAADIMPERRRGGDSEVAAALNLSVVPFNDIIQNRMMPRSSPVPSPEPSPSPTPSPGLPVVVDSYKPSFEEAPILPPAIPQYLVGDAFDLDPAICGRFDRVYVGAGTPEDHVDFFVSLLHPGGRLCGPFGSSMQLISKSRTGVIAREKVSEVSYASIVLPSAGVRTMPKPQLRFAQSYFDPMARRHTRHSTHPIADALDRSCIEFLPRRMQSALDALLMLRSREGARWCLIGCLPLSLLANIVTFLPIDAYLDRETGDLPWQPDFLGQLTLARTKHSMADHVGGGESDNEAEQEAAFKSAEQLCLDALGHLEVVKDWLEVRLPTMVPALDKDSPPSSDAALVELLKPSPATVGGVERDITALREIREDPQRVGAGRTIRDDPLDQVVQLSWLINWKLCQLYSYSAGGKKPAAGARAAKRLLAFRPNDTIAWKMLSSNTFEDGNLIDARKACLFAQRCSVLAGEPESERTSIAQLLRMIDARMPSYRQQQQQVSNRLIRMLGQSNNATVKATSPCAPSSLDRAYL
jgi:protein-L-isoaspartate O-methyltransferase